MKKIFLFIIIIISFHSAFAQKNESDSIKIVSKTTTTTDNSTNTDDYLAKPFNIATPEVSQLVKSELIPINYATGRAEYSIPIFEVKEGNISIPIMLKYSSNGIKVNQESTNVGLDWVLIAGGSVTKFVNDIDDNKYRVNQNASNYSRQIWDQTWETFLTVYDPSYDWGQYISKKGWMINDSDIEYMPDSKITATSSNFELYTDLAPDTFFAVAPGLNSKFYLNKKTVQDSNWDARFSTYSYKGREMDGLGNKIYVNKYDKFDISNVPNNGWMGWSTVFPSNCNSILGNLDTYASQNNFSLLKNNAKDYDQFQIINSSGNIYSFKTNDININSSIETPFSFTDLSPEAPKSKKSICKLLLKNNYNIDINTWNLDSILDITSNKKVTFKYKEYTQSKNKVKDYDQGKVIASSFILNYGNQTGTDFYPGGGSTPIDYTVSRYGQNSVYHYVEEINWSEGKVKFFYDFTRSDSFDDNSNVAPKKALSQIIVYDLNGQIIKKVKLNYGYYKNTQVTSDLDLRLRLDDVAVYNKDDTFLYNYRLEYDNSSIPSKGSSQSTKNYRDLFGYFKQSSVGTFPKTYYQIVNQKFKFENLPFNNTTLLYGDLDMTPDNNASIGMLSKITTPTGGTHKFLYEPNKFIWNGQEQTGGGIRVKEQLINDGTIERRIEYKYADENGITTGRLGGPPSMITNRGGDYYTFYGNSGTTAYPAVYSSQQNRSEADEGNFVLYEKVVEKEAGKGKQVISFTGFSDFPNIYPHLEDHSGGIYFSSLTAVESYYKNRSQLRAKMLNKEIYAEGISLPIRTENYQYKIAKDVSTNFNVFFANSYNFKPSWDLIIDNTPENLILYKKIIRNNYSTPSSFTEQQMIQEYYNLSPILSNGEPVSYNYLNTVFLPKKEKMIDSDGSIMETYYYYPLDQGFQYLVGLNVIGIPQQKIAIKKQNEADAGKIISTVYKNYPLSQTDADSKTAGFPVAYSAFSTEIENGAPVLEFSYDKYDNKGNLQQFSTKVGIPTTIIWGYNQTKPIAKIEGAKLLDIDPSLISTIVNASNIDATALPNGDETALLGTLDAFRVHSSLRDYKITTYTHDPLVGLRSITMPLGTRENYIYDSAFRLQKVTNGFNKIVKEYTYGYVPTTYYYNIAKSQSFTKNNCGTGMIPLATPISYTVPAGKYSSTISQAAANQTAQNDIDVNGQNYANANGICTYTCTITPESNVQIYYSSFQPTTSASHISAILSFPTTASGGGNLNWSSGVFMGNLSTLCVPNSYKTINVSANGTSWTVSLQPNGSVIVKANGGGSVSSVTLNFEYDKN